MKTHTIKTPTAELMIVELPRLCDYHASSRKLWVKDTQSGEELTVKGSWELLGKPDEIREDDAKELVDELECSNQWCENGKIPQGYGAFSICSVCEDIYLKSLLSLLESEIYWDVSPFGLNKPTPESHMLLDSFEFTSISKAWHEAEQKTFDRNRSLIFKKKI